MSNIDILDGDIDMKKNLEGEHGNAMEMPLFWVVHKPSFPKTEAFVSQNCKTEAIFPKTESFSFLKMETLFPKRKPPPLDSTDGTTEQNRTATNVRGLSWKISSRQR